MLIDDGLSALLDDPDFRELQDRMARFNIFQAIGAVHSELRHSDFLAYLLSPSRPHGLGTRPLQQVLRRLLEAIPPNERPVSTLELLVGDLDNAVVHRERDRMDLLIEIDALELVVVIENKIHAKAGIGQLKSYRELVETRYPKFRKLLVFLTPEGHAPDDDGYWPLSYVILAKTLEALASELPTGDPTQLVVRHYVEMLRKNIVEDAHLRSLAAKLYERHAEALDFIFASRPRPASLVESVAEKVRNVQGLIVDSSNASMLRFAPEQWDEHLSYTIDRGHWTHSGRGLLFEIKTSSSKPGRITVALVMGPGDALYRKALYEAARSRPELFTGLVKPMGVKWSTIFSRDLLTAERAAALSAEVQVSDVGLAWSEFQGTTLPELIGAILEIDAEIDLPPTAN